MTMMVRFARRRVSTDRDSTCALRAWIAYFSVAAFVMLMTRRSRIQAAQWPEVL